MTTPSASYQTAADVLASWRDDMLSGTPPVLYPVGTVDLGRIGIGPQLVTLIGGVPGAGQTASVMQLAVDALRLTPSLRAVVCFGGNRWQSRCRRTWMAGRHGEWRKQRNEQDLCIGDKR